MIHYFILNISQSNIDDKCRGRIHTIIYEERGDMSCLVKGKARLGYLYVLSKCILFAYVINPACFNCLQRRGTKTQT